MTFSWTTLGAVALAAPLPAANPAKASASPKYTSMLLLWAAPRTTWLRPPEDLATVSKKARGAPPPPLPFASEGTRTDETLMW